MDKLRFTRASVDCPSNLLQCARVVAYYVSDATQMSHLHLDDIVDGEGCPNELFAHCKYLVFVDYVHCLLRSDQECFRGKVNYIGGVAKLNRVEGLEITAYQVNYH